MNKQEQDEKLEEIAKKLVSLKPSDDDIESGKREEYYLSTIEDDTNRQIAEETHNIILGIRKTLLSNSKCFIFIMYFGGLLILLIWILIILIFSCKMLVLAIHSTPIVSFIRVVDFFRETSVGSLFVPVSVAVSGLLGWFIAKK